MTEKFINKKIADITDFIYKNVDNERLLQKFLCENIFLKKLYSEMDKEYYNIIKPIVESDIFKTTRIHLHHDNVSTYTHMLHVSLIAYQDAKKKKLDYISAAIGGLLHDFYLYDWHVPQYKDPGLFNKHLFTHPVVAAKNAKKYFPNLINKKIKNIIIAHTWHSYILEKMLKPSFNLYNHVPHSKEAWIVAKADIKASMYSFQTPRMFLSSLGMDKYIDRVCYFLANNKTLNAVISVFH